MILTNSKIRDFFNSDAQDKYSGSYEFNRWFLNSKRRTDYYMTYAAVHRSMHRVEFHSVLELGPGPGTWTRIPYRMNPKASFVLVDISEQMKKQFYDELRSSPNVVYNVGDAMDYLSGASYDLVFTSRTFEYLDNKELFIQGLHEVLNIGGKGVVVTKNAEFGLRKKKKSWQHSGQWGLDKLRDQLISAGFKDVRVYPAVIRIPILSRFGTLGSEWIFNHLFDKQVRKWIVPLCESFVITFKK